MKQRILVALTALMCLLLLFGCAHQHKWAPANCEEPKICTSCWESEGEPLGHTWVETESGKQICEVCGRSPRLDLPESGTILLGEDLEPWSELTFTNKSSANCCIKLKDDAGNDVLAFFVRSGDEITAPVPSGYYYVYFAFGWEGWYGLDDAFLEVGEYRKDPELLDFENHTWEYALDDEYYGDVISYEEF